MTAITNKDQTIRNSQAVGLSKIKDLVQRFKVCWEVHPEQALVTWMDLKEKGPRVNRELRKIGYSLELYGTPEPGAEQLSPGCHDCRAVESALKEIAEWILPREERQCQCLCEVQVDTQALTYSRMRADRPDIRVTIQILHRNNWEQPIDECEEGCLKDVERALQELGACNGAWTRSI